MEKFLDFSKTAEYTLVSIFFESWNIFCKKRKTKIVKKFDYKIVNNDNNGELEKSRKLYRVPLFENLSITRCSTNSLPDYVLEEEGALKLISFTPFCVRKHNSTVVAPRITPFHQVIKVIFLSGNTILSRTSLQPHR